MTTYTISPEIQEKVNSLKQNLEKFRVALEKNNYMHHKKEFFSIMNEFWEFASSMDDEETYEYFEHSQYFTKYRSFFSSKEQYYVRTIEAIEAVNIMTKSIKENINFYDLLERKMAKENYLKTSYEIEMMDLEGSKTLVMVGCGPLPETILYLYDNTELEEIIGLDYNQEAVFMGGEMLNSVGNTSRVNLIHCDGTEYIYENADIIFVANFVTPKIKVLQQIANTARNGAKVLVRTPIFLGKMLYESVIHNLPSRLTLRRKGNINPYFLDQSLLLEKLDL